MSFNANAEGSDFDSSDETTPYNDSTNDFKSIQQDGDVTKCGDKLVFNPFNTDNVEITLNEVQSILKKYGINAPIHNIELYKRAFIHSSYIKRSAIENKANDVVIVNCPKGCMELKTKSNERLEFIGDGVLELITKYYLYRRFPKADEGFMTEKKIAVVKNEHIGKLVFETHIDWVKLINTDDNYKNILQVKVQKEFKTTPAYLEMSHNADAGYEMGVYLCVGIQLHEVKIKEAKPFSLYGSFLNVQKHLQENGWVFVFLGSGTHKIKKKAEQIACEVAIKQIQ